MRSRHRLAVTRSPTAPGPASASGGEHVLPRERAIPLPAPCAVHGELHLLAVLPAQVDPNAGPRAVPSSSRPPVGDIQSGLGIRPLRAT